MDQQNEQVVQNIQCKTITLSTKIQCLFTILDYRKLTIPIEQFYILSNVFIKRYYIKIVTKLSRVK